MLTASDNLLPVYATLPVRPVSGSGAWLVDDEGNRWLDAYGGHAVASTGRSHPRVVAAIREQAERLIFCSTVLPQPNRERLAARLRTSRTAVVSVAGGWHGRTVAALAVTDGERYEAGARRAGMTPSPKVPFDDAAALADFVTADVAALIVEPVQGMAGARDCSPAFLRAAREACDRAGALLIFDEVQCGAGRCGAFTAAEAYGVVPDLLTLAKGLASGLPIGAVVARPGVVEGIAIGDLGSTFGGEPVPCAAALATLDVLRDENLVARAVAVGEHVRDGALAAGIRRVTGRGLLLGLHLERPASEVQKALLGRRILTGLASDPRVLRLLPPLVFSEAEADLLLGALGEVMAS